MNIVIYTAIFGNFDILKKPKVINKNVKYICFSDKFFNCYPWKIKLVKPEYKDLKREARKYKILTHKFLKNFEYSIWIDGRYTIVNDFSHNIKKWLDKNDIAVQKHPTRNCLYDEAQACLSLGLDDKSIIKEQIGKYKKDNYSEKHGLVETGFLIRKHTEQIVKFNEMWWNEVKNYSTRDQISFNYIIHKLQMNYSIIPIPNPRKQHTKYLILRKHKGNLKYSYFSLIKLIRKFWRDIKENRSNIKQIYIIIRENLYYLYLLSS